MKTTAQAHRCSPPTTHRRALRAIFTRAPRAAFTRALAACLFVALPAAVGGGLGGAAHAQAGNPTEEVIETVRTRAGELSLARGRRGEATTIVIRLDGRLVAEKGASEEGDGYRDASIHGTYPKSSPRYALVSLTTGALVCAAKFSVVDLSTRGRARATADFGNCSDSPRVSYRNNTLTITFPAGPRRHDPGTHYVGPGQVWSYGGGRLRQIGRRR